MSRMRIISVDMHGGIRTEDLASISKLITIIHLMLELIEMLSRHFRKNLRKGRIRILNPL